MNITPIELVAAVFGIAGTLFLAGKGRFAGYGFVAYLLSNFAWIAFAVDRELYGLLLQQLVFTLSSMYGVWMWLIRPARQIHTGTPPK